MRRGLLKTAISLLILLRYQYSDAQTTAVPVKSMDYYPRAKFILAAPLLVPELVEEGKWDQLQNFIENWKRSDAPSEELIFCISTLSAIENKRFSVLQLPCYFFYYLEDYARELKNIDENSPKFRYYLRVSFRHSVDATSEAREFMLFARSWATRLMTARRLNSTEQFFCQVFAGDIRHPRSAFQGNRESYADLNSFERNLDMNNRRYFNYLRNRTVGTFGYMTGIWLPTGNLKILGVHPGIGKLLGVRNKKNEYDLVGCFRFLSAPGNYMVLRSDSLYARNYYVGGNIGFDYTRYVLHKTYFDLGIISAIGYDQFNIANGSGQNDSTSYLAPIYIGSFDFSNGLRFKYFFHRGGFVGLAAKYHLIHYANKGGSDLGGNAITIDLICGSY